MPQIWPTTAGRLHVSNSIANSLRWDWDPARAKHYYVDSNRLYYVYEDGEMVAAVFKQDKPSANWQVYCPLTPLVALLKHALRPSLLPSMSTMSFGVDPVPTPGGEYTPYSQYDHRPLQFVSSLDYQQPFRHQSALTRFGDQPPHEVPQEYQDRWGNQGSGIYAETGAHSAYSPYFQSHQQVEANTSYSQGPTDEQKLQTVGRNVEVEPGETDLPQELQNRGLRHRMILRGTGGDRERLDGSK
jgi:hypothetical protein